MSKIYAEHDLVRRALVRGLRFKVRYELLNAQDRILNDVENAALARFDEAVVRGDDFHAVSDELLGGTVDVRASLS